MERPGVRKIAIEIGVMIAIACACAMAGPFGTFALPLRVRLIEWLVFALGGYAFFRPVVAGGEALAARARLPRLAAMAFACLLAAMPTTLLVAAVFAGGALARVTLADLGGLYPAVLLVGALTTAIQLLVHARRAGAPGEAVPPAEPAEPEPEPEPATISFADRLPPALGADLLALENEDHYVRAHTALGSALILMRMRDAVAELGAIEGLRTHRSWWVARAAVERVVRRDRAVALRLVNGLEVPVARNEVPALRAAGWLCPRLPSAARRL